MDYCHAEGVFGLFFGTLAAAESELARKAAIALAANARSGLNWLFEQAPPQGRLRPGAVTCGWHYHAYQKYSNLPVNARPAGRNGFMLLRCISDKVPFSLRAMRNGLFGR